MICHVRKRCEQVTGIELHFSTVVIAVLVEEMGEYESKDIAFLNH